MNILDKWTMAKQPSSPYADILLNDADIANIQSVWKESFLKLEDITRIILALELSKEKITISEFKGAMLYAKHLRSYFNK